MRVERPSWDFSGLAARWYIRGGASTDIRTTGRPTSRSSCCKTIPQPRRRGLHIWVRATSQWFANLDAIKEDALTALKDVDFYPAICMWSTISQTCAH